MRPIMIYNAILSSIWTLNLFDEPFVIYGPAGGPNESALLMSHLVYRNAFSYFNISYASANAFMITMIVVIISIIMFRYSRTEY
jgi:lactose/L-arabinose transport system permease protein